MFYLDKTDKTDNFSAEDQSQNVFQISQKLIVDFYHCFTSNLLYHFLSFKTIRAPVFFSGEQLSTNSLQNTGAPVFLSWEQGWTFSRK